MIIRNKFISLKIPESLEIIKLALQHKKNMPFIYINRLALYVNGLNSFK